MSTFHELSPEHLKELCDIIAQWCGITIDDKGAVMLEFRMHPLLEKYGCSGGFGEFLRLARSGRTEIRDDVIDAVTTNETLWFRDGHLYESLHEEILPDLVQDARSQGRTGLNIWSAAASTGQEAYSISMLLHELVKEGRMKSTEMMSTKIVATDISPAALQIARKGAYDSISMGRGMWPGFKEKYFTDAGKSCQVRREVQRPVTFERRNLMDSFFGLGPFDIVFLRNVLIYFSPEMKSGTLARVRQAMHPGGVLIVGACEDATRYSRDYESCRKGKVLYYQNSLAS